MKKGGTKTKTRSPARVQLDMINREMGEEVVGMGSDPRFVIQRVDSGSLAMNRVTGGGFPRGRHVELFGDYGALKTTIAYMTMALAQQRGETCMLVDGESALDPVYFRHFGGKPKELLVSRPRTAEKAIKTLMLFADQDDDLQNPGAGVVFIDSVASMLPMEELAKDVETGDDRTAGRARMMSKLMRRVTAVNQDTLFLWANQTIDSVGGYGGRTTPGGRALKFYASVRIEMRNEKRVKKGRKTAVKDAIVQKDMALGKWVLLRAEKQKTARPETEAQFYYDFDRRRISRAAEAVTLGLEDGLVERIGNKFHYEPSDGPTLSGTYANFVSKLEGNKDVLDELAWVIEQNTIQLADPMDGE